MSPVGGDQLTVALNPSRLCTVVGRGTDLGTRGLKIRQINNTMHYTTACKTSQKYIKLGEIRVKGKKKKNSKKRKRKQNNRSSTFGKKMDPLCFNRPSKSKLPISIRTIYESSNFFSTELIQPAIHSGLYFKALSLCPSLLHSSSFGQPHCLSACLKTHPGFQSPLMLSP